MFDGQFPDARCTAYIAPDGPQCLLDDGHDGDHHFSGAEPLKKIESVDEFIEDVLGAVD